MYVFRVNLKLWKRIDVNDVVVDFFDFSEDEVRELIFGVY